MVPVTHKHGVVESGYLLYNCMYLRMFCGCWWLSWAQDFLGLSRWWTLWAGVLYTQLRWRWSTTSGSMRSYTWVWGNRWRGLWGRCLSAVWWKYSPATQHRGIVPLIGSVLAVHHSCEFMKSLFLRNVIFCVLSYLLLLYPDQSHNSENSMRTACSWASRAPRRSRWCTRLSHLWAHHDQGCLASLECRWLLDYRLCQGCLLAPECSYHTKETWKRGSGGGSWQ